MEKTLLRFALNKPKRGKTLMGTILWIYYFILFYLLLMEGSKVNCILEHPNRKEKKWRDSPYPLPMFQLLLPSFLEVINWELVVTPLLYLLVPWIELSIFILMMNHSEWFETHQLKTLYVIDLEETWHLIMNNITFHSKKL